METRVFDLLWTEAWLILGGNKTLDSELGPDNATADEFAKTNKIKRIDEDKTTIRHKKQKHNKQRKNTRTYQVATSRGNPCKQALS